MVIMLFPEYGYIVVSNPKSCESKYVTTGMCRVSSKYETLRRQNKHWLTRMQTCQWDITIPVLLSSFIILSKSNLFIAHGKPIIANVFAITLKSYTFKPFIHKNI